MKRLRRWPIYMFSVLMAGSLPGQQRTATAFRITGMVVNAQDSAPVNHCHLTASLVAPNSRGVSREPLQADTDEHGRFTLVVPSAGNWQLQAKARHFRNQSLNEHEGYFSGVILTAANPVYDLVFRAVPDAQLAGTITDEAGEPVRNAQISLFQAASSTSTEPHKLQQRNGTQTDDRGHYQFTSLEPGSYLVQVQARPWYATVPGPERRLGPGGPAANQSTEAKIDPSLDVVYPVTWYPGVRDSAAASRLIAHPGDRLDADFRLLPEASSHLLIPSREPGPVPSNEPRDPGRLERGGLGTLPSLALMLQDGTTQPVYAQFSQGPKGDLEIGGLAPGTYQVTLPGSGPESQARTSVVRIQSGASTIELASPLPATPVSIAVDGAAEVSASGIILRSMMTGELYASRFQTNDVARFMGPPAGSGKRPAIPFNREQAMPRGRPGTGGGRTRNRQSEGGEDATLQVPPGKYQVEVGAGSPIFITGLSALGASVIGRTLTIGDAPTRLTVHLASGLATVSGVATADGKPDVGAMTLLIPATFGSPASLSTVQRDQTNTDGSFRLENVIPGQYILVALHDGWGADWSQPSAMQAYLMHGIPLDLKSGASVSREIVTTHP